MAQASSLRTLSCARIRWHAIRDEAQSPPEVGLENSVLVHFCTAYVAVAGLSLCVKRVLVSQALMVMYDDLIVMESLKAQCAELSQVLPAHTLSGSDATKENVIERVTSRTASLVHFLVHGTPGGRADRSWCRNKQNK